MSKPSFVYKRLLLLFNSDDELEKQRIVDNYNRLRGERENEDGLICYCGHTTRCDCGDPHISEFKHALERGLFSEKTLNKILR